MAIKECLKQDEHFIHVHITNNDVLNVPTKNITNKHKALAELMQSDNAAAIAFTPNASSLPVTLIVLGSNPLDVKAGLNEVLFLLSREQRKIDGECNITEYRMLPNIARTLTFLVVMAGCISLFGIKLGIPDVMQRFATVIAFSGLTLMTALDLKIWRKCDQANSD